MVTWQEFVAAALEMAAFGAMWLANSEFSISERARLVDDEPVRQRWQES